MNHIKQQTIIGLRELRENVDEYIEQVKNGHWFTVVRRSKPVFNIAPVNSENEYWEEVMDFTKIKKGGVNIKEILSRL
jgi:prevent-host-death family protein